VVVAVFLSSIPVFDCVLPLNPPVLVFWIELLESKTFKVRLNNIRHPFQIGEIITELIASRREAFLVLDPTSKQELRPQHLMINFNFSKNEYLLSHMTSLYVFQ
jgi:hypothetical protein